MSIDSDDILNQKYSGIIVVVIQFDMISYSYKVIFIWFSYLGMTLLYWKRNQLMIHIKGARTMHDAFMCCYLLGPYNNFKMSINY